jgi:hypothetical protein
MYATFHSFCVSWNLLRVNMYLALSVTQQFTANDKCDITALLQYILHFLRTDAMQLPLNLHRS